jgi:hypothetical protein
VAHDGSTAHHYVIPRRIEFRAKDFHISDTSPPECSQYIPDEDVLDNAFA